MSARPQPHLAAPLALLALMLGTFALLGAGCSKDNTAAPTGSTGGPSLGFTFPSTGTSHQFQFTTEGTWAYHCVPHQSSGMTGTVNVNSSATDDSVLVQVGPSDALSFSPASVSIKPNGTVRWVNVSSMTNHTVTRP